MFPGGRAVQLPERLEHGLELVGWDARPLVRHLRHREAVFGPPTHRDPAAAGRELDRVGHEVHDHLNQAIAHPEDHLGFRGGFGRDGHALLLRERRDGLDASRDAVRERHRLELEFHAAGLEPREVEQVVDEPDHSVRVADRDLEQLARRGIARSGGAGEEQRERRLHRCHGSPELVAGYRDELGLRPLDFHLVGHVAVQHDVAEQRAAAFPHGGHHTLVHSAPGKRELDPVPQRGVER